MRRTLKMMTDVMNALNHVGDAVNCELRVARRTRGTRGGRHKHRRRAAGCNNGSTKEGLQPELPEENMGWASEWSETKMGWVAVVNRGENLDKMRARQATARARKAEEENHMLRKRLELREKKVREDVATGRGCLQFLDTKEFRGMELDEVLLILETRWRQAEARVSNQKSMLELLEQERERSAALQHALQEQLGAAKKELRGVAAATERAGAERAAAAAAASIPWICEVMAQEVSWVAAVTATERAAAERAAAAAAAAIPWRGEVVAQEVSWVAAEATAEKATTEADEEDSVAEKVDEQAPKAAAAKVAEEIALGEASAAAVPWRCEAVPWEGSLGGAEASAEAAAEKVAAREKAAAAEQAAATTAAAEAAALGTATQAAAWVLLGALQGRSIRLAVWDIAARDREAHGKAAAAEAEVEVAAAKAVTVKNLQRRLENTLLQQREQEKVLARARGAVGTLPSQVANMRLSELVLDLQDIVARTDGELRWLREKIRDEGAGGDLVSPAPPHLEHRNSGSGGAGSELAGPAPEKGEED